jgi:5-methylthioadenosine/S-adenosylhomocysteine deaminase
VIDLDDPSFTPLVSGNRNQLYAHLAFAAQGRAVRTVVIDGAVVMHDRTLLTVDVEEIEAKATEAFVRVLAGSGVDDEIAAGMSTTGGEPMP